MMEKSPEDLIRCYVIGAQKLMVARRATEYRTTVIRYFASEYCRKTELPPLKETTVYRLKDLYLKEQLRVERDIPSVEDFVRFATKKNGCPLKIGEDLDKQVREYYMTYLRSTGTSINTTVVIASAEGILMHEDADLLSRVDLNKGWAQYLLHYVKHQANCDGWKFYCSNGRLFARNQASNNNGWNSSWVDYQLWSNWFPSSDWTMEAKGAKQVEAVGKDDKR